MARLSFMKKLTAPGSYLHETFLEDSDGCAKGRQCILVGTLSASIITSLTAGIYFTSLMLAMGASETYIGYVTAIISFSGLFQLFAPLLLEKLPRRKELLLAARSIYYLLDIVAMGVIPLLPIGHALKLVLFMVTLVLLHAINYIATPGISAWHMQSLPMTKRVNFYTISNVGTTILNQISAFLAGLLLDHFEANTLSFRSMSPTMTAIIILRLVALLFAALECRKYACVKEFPYEADPSMHTEKGIRLLMQPLKDKLFMRTIFIPVAWTFITGIVGQYFSIYLLEDVKMSYSLIALGGFISTPITVLSTPLWYRTIRKLSWPKVLAIGQLGNMLAYFCNALITGQTQAFYFLCIILGSCFGTCINIVHSNLVYLHMPTSNRTSYFSFYSILTLLASFLGVYFGILFITLTNGIPFPFFGFYMGNKQYINLVSVLLYFVLSLFTLSYCRRKEHNISVVF